MRYQISQRIFGPENLDSRLRAGLIWHGQGGGSGITIPDQSGYQRPGNLNGGILWTLGREHIGHGVSLDGSDDEISIPANLLAGLSAFAVAYWAYPRSITAGYLQKWEGGTGNLVLIRDDATGTISFFTFTGAQVGGVLIGGHNTNEWAHWVFMYDGATMSGYKNAQIGGTTYGQTGALQSGGTATTRIGGGSGSSSERFFNGNFSDIRIYNRALSIAEIVLLASPSFRPVMVQRVVVAKKSGVVLTPFSPQKMAVKLGTWG